MMDKNKSAYKLKNFGPVYYLNLDGQPERKEYMESQFDYWEITDYTRISAYDGRDDDLSDIIKGRYPSDMTSGEIGCTTSHLKAIKHWMKHLIVHMLLLWRMIVILILQDSGTLHGRTLLLESLMRGTLFNLPSSKLVIFTFLFTQDL